MNPPAIAKKDIDTLCNCLNITITSQCTENSLLTRLPRQEFPRTFSSILDLAADRSLKTSRLTIGLRIGREVTTFAALWRRRTATKPHVQPTNTLFTCGRMSASTVPTGEGGGPKSFVRRDRLREIEHKVQAKWAEQKEFEATAPPQASYAGGEKPGKFMTTFPYPYMNGRLHLGHAFTVTKSEFAAGYNRLRGKKVLFPFAFHCTGMPIQAAANKLKREIEGGIQARLAAAAANAASEAAADAAESETAAADEPMAGEAPTAAAAAAEAPAAAAAAATAGAGAAPAGAAKEKELGKFSGKKSKAVAKTGTGAYV